MTILVLGAAVHLVLPQLAALEHTLAVLRAMKWWSVVAAVLTQVLSYWGSGYVLQGISRLFGFRLSLQRAVMTTTAAYSLGLLWGGQITNAGATYRWMRAAGLTGEGAFLAGWLPALVNVFSLCLVSIFGLVTLLTLHELSTALAVGFAFAVLILVAVGAAMAVGMRHPTVVATAWHAPQRAWARLGHRDRDARAAEETATRLTMVAELFRKGGWRPLIAGDAVNIGFDILTLFLLFIAAGYVVSPGVLLAGYGLPLLLGKISFVPGGVGVVEASMAALYGILGVPDPVLVVVILAYRLLSFWLPMLIGFAAAVYLDHDARRHGAASRSENTS